ncbi:hypothetical protein B0H10DRAFT_1990449 [Mycena sp. CBHHK59/15]|nr:hypothetical protein B0H10DRAFT_1990449 [Mycena sp. CBHHK59/15]
MTGAPRPLCDLKVAIITENFLPKIDGVTVTLAHLLDHFQANGVKAILLGPESGMDEYAGCRIFGASGIPLKAYPGLKINFMPPSFIRTLREFDPDVIHLVDPIWLGVQALALVKILFPGTPVVTSQDTNLPTYATVFGFPYFRRRIWRVSSCVHSFAKFTLVPSTSTASILRRKGFANLRVCDRGVDPDLFNPSLRNSDLRESWGMQPGDLAVLSVGRLSPEKNLPLLIEAFSLLSPDIRKRAILVFVGDGPLASQLQQLCFSKGIRAIFLGQVTGIALGETFASADIMSSPSFTETLGQTTLEALASKLPVVGLFAEGTSDLVTHLTNGLLLDVHATVEPTESWKPSQPLDSPAQVACYDSCAHLMWPSSNAFLTIARRYSALLDHLICHPTLRLTMGSAALSTVGEYTWERCAGNILSVYVEAARYRARTPYITSNPRLFPLLADALVLILAIFVAAITHMVYMIPTSADLLF